MKIFILSIIILLTGCGSLQKPETITVTEYVDKECVINTPDKINLRDIKWVIIDGQWIALTPDDYEDLSYNTAEQLRYIRQANVIIRRCKGD